MKASRTKSTVLVLASVTATLVACAATASQILTFDDLPESGFLSAIPNGYGGLQWQNFYYIDGTTETPDSGYVNGIVSPNNVAYNGFGNSATIIGAPFDLDSAYLTAAWNDNLQLEVQGFVGATLTYDQTYTLNTTGSTLINFNDAGVDEVEFISSGGTPNPGLGGSGGEQFVMDNLSITLVPEPSTFALASLATISLFLHRRRLQAAQ